MPARACRDQERRHINRELCDELAILRSVFTRFHIAAAAPGLVADAPILHAERLFVAVGSALVGQTLGPGRSVAIRNPIVKFPGRARTDIGREVWLGADQAAKPHELMNAEMVGLRRMPSGRHPMLPKIVSPRTPGCGAYAVAPMVTVGEAASRPAQVRSADSLHIVNELFADPVYVGNPGIASNPDAVIDHATEMLDEMPVDVGVDDRAWFVRRYFDFNVRGRIEP